MTRAGSRRSNGSAPLVKDPARYKTELCSTWTRMGGCPYGHKCQFAHGVDELRARQDQPSSYKTKVCRSFSRSGRCPYGARCRFVHGDVVEAQQLAMLRLMGESPVAQTNEPQPLAGHAAPTPSQGALPQLQPHLPSAGPLDLGLLRTRDHGPVLAPYVQPQPQPQQKHPGQQVDEAQTSYASSTFSSSRYSSPQLPPQQHMHQLTPMMAPAAAAPGAPTMFSCQTLGTTPSPIGSPTGGALPTAFLPFALPPSIPDPLTTGLSIRTPRHEAEFWLEPAAEAGKASAHLTGRTPSGESILGGEVLPVPPVGESILGDEAGLQYTQSLAEQLAEMCMSPERLPANGCR